ncbi:unnamed protein product [Oncorhynchus mykiss]|uniref:Uncharacterized protein n=1 Tax=Oncorhynchus mykiss TaxID=8022 RepID=A0A060X1L9_ONCMY|nr:unnamed protein product [Oncorhynchus mykiss]
MNRSSTGSPAKLSTFQRQYTDLLEASLWRHRYLASLYDYMQGCSKELVYLSEYQERILRKDWSDRMLDPPGVRMEYEKFKNNTLLTHESETKQLQMDGDRLVEMKHPASSTIRAHSDALQNEWQSFLNLCICQEVHLDNIDNYRKYQLDVETLSESMKRLNSNLDPKSLNNKKNPEILLQLEGDERAIERNEQRLVALREFSSTIAPLKLRRIRPTKPTPVLSLCEWTNGEDSVSQAEKLMLKSNLDDENWEVQTSTGKTKTLPGACFLVPPPDTEALEKVESLYRELSNLKRKRTTLMASLRSPGVEVVHSVRAAPVANAPVDPKTTVLASQLDKISKNLDHSEKDILSRLRAPLDRSDPTHDLANRLKEHERATLTVRNLEAEKAAVQRDMDPILAQKPLGPTTSALSLKLSGLNNKFDDTNVLCDLYNKKATASMFLERQINMVDNSVSGFEEQLAEDAALPDVPNVLQTRIAKLQNMRKDVALKQDEMLKLSRDLESTEQLSSSLQKGFHEYCPDIRRQQTEVKHLKNRYANVNSQLQERTVLLQEATNKNQGFQSSVQSLNLFLTNLPNNTINPSDGLSQINFKQNSQKRVVEDIKRKSDDVGLAVKQSRDLQNVLNEYEAKSAKYRGTLKDVDDEDAKRCHTSAMADAVLKKERALLNLYSEVSAENDQLLNKMGLAKNIIAQNEEKVSQVVVKQERQLQSQQKDLEETDVLKRELADETTRRSHAENELATYRKRFISLKSRRGVERMEEREVVQYYRDPKLEGDLKRPTIKERVVKKEVVRLEKDPEMLKAVLTFQTEISEEGLEEENKINSDLMKELTSLQIRYSEVEKVRPKLEVKEIINEIYRVDPETEVELVRLRKELHDSNRNRTDLEKEIDSVMVDLKTLRSQKPKSEYKEVTQEVIKEEKSPEVIREIKRLNDQVSLLRVSYDSTLNLLSRLRKERDEWKVEKSKLETKLVNKEVVKYENDPLLEKEADRLRRDVREEIQQRRNMEETVFDLQNKYIMVERQKPEEKIVMQEVVRLEKDPKQLLEYEKLNKNLDEEVKSRRKLELEVIRVEKDQNVEAERDHLRDLVLQERSSRRDQEDEIQRLNTKVTRLQTTKSSTSHEETSITLNRDSLMREKENLLQTLRTLESEKHDLSISFQLQSKLMSERNQINRQRGFKMDSEVQRLEKDILDEKDRIHQKETYIMELQNNLKKEDHSETHTRETNLSTRISILDPETGKDMSPYDAYLEGLIDRNKYIQLQELECDWEEITSMGPDGETSILQDRKSGKQFSVKNALKDGRLTQSDLHRYKEGKMPISEFALLVAGESRPKPYIGPIATPRTPTKTTAASSLSTMPSSLSNLNISSGDELFPISGVLDSTTNSRMSVRSALTRNLIDPTTAQKLLEAQAATGGIVDLNRKDKFSVHKAVELGLIDKSHMHLLLNAQKAFTGVEDPVTKERLAVGQAAEKGWIPQDSAMRYMEAQYLTGGLVNPHKAGRISVQDALNTKIIDSTVAKNLQDKSAHTKELIDPITKEKISYKEAMDRCKKDVTTGLLLLPAASSGDSKDAPSYSNYRIPGSYSQV